MSAKQTYVNGSYLTPTAINGYFGVDAATGHHHSGANDSTSAPKVLLSNAAEVQGKLPVSSIDYTEGDFTCSFDDFMGGHLSKVVHYRVTPPVQAASNHPSVVTLNFPSIDAVSTGVHFQDSSGNVPAACRPYNFGLVPVIALNGGEFQMATCRINSSGNIYFSVVETDGTNVVEVLDNWHVGGTKRTYEFTMSYPKY